MKRKKWSESEERTLLTKYSDLLTSGTLAKLKTREKKFKPIAEHLNSLHHLPDPITFPFKWSWRDVSIKVQNMRHQYLGVKQKIRVSDMEYNWEDGENHWENFIKYKEVFGDIELESNGSNKRFVEVTSGDVFGDSGFGCSGDEFFGLGFDELGNHNEDDDNNDGNEFGGGDEAGSGDEVGVTKGGNEGTDGSGSGSGSMRKCRKGANGRMLALVSGQVLELRDVMMRREEKRKEREWKREETNRGRDEREMESRMRLEMEFEEERRRRMKVEERWEEEEMKWREKMVRMQIEHEKQMMQLHANACQNQMQILGVMARFFCQFFGSASDGLGSLAPQVLQHPIPTGLDDNGKPDANSPSEFL